MFFNIKYMIGTFVSVVKGVCLSEERRVKSEKSKCKRSAVDFFNILRSIIINKTNVPADLQSAGIEYKDLFNPITSYFL